MYTAKCNPDTFLVNFLHKIRMVSPFHYGDTYASIKASMKYTTMPMSVSIIFYFSCYRVILFSVMVLSEEYIYPPSLVPQIM